ncbi:hypothetical protein GGR56DRAFT_80527 [Xylariaceae sp. FL0804]|nr:hypothetical protein GGR56DRAFT_80527 [Xylariaceae sp. FL0804]
MRPSIKLTISSWIAALTFATRFQDSFGEAETAPNCTKPKAKLSATWTGGVVIPFSPVVYAARLLPLGLSPGLRPTREALPIHRRMTSLKHTLEVRRICSSFYNRPLAPCSGSEPQRGDQGMGPGTEFQRQAGTEGRNTPLALAIDNVCTT